MKFVYKYRTSDNVQHDGEINAANREAAFQRLREKGIRPGRLEAVPGVANWLCGNGIRWLIVGIFMVAVFATATMILRDRAHIRRMSEASPYADADGFAKPIDRRQIWGDGAVIAVAASKNWRIIFSNPADRLLALFAEPGVELSMMPRLPATLKADMDKALAARARIEQNDLDEYKQMKCIVEGMKAELRAYLAAGGKLEGYIRRLQKRQREEVEFLAKARVELHRKIDAGADVVDAWEEMNRMVREQGLPALPLPDSN